MTPLEIQFELRKRDITQISIANELGVSGMMVSLVIRKLSTSERIIESIASKINRDPRAIFPEFYNNPRRRKAA